MIVPALRFGTPRPPCGRARRSPAPNALAHNGCTPRAGSVLSPVAARLPRTTRLRFALHGAQRRLGDPLRALNEAVDWSVFEPILEKGLKKEKKSNAGRPRFDALLMF